MPGTHWTSQQEALLRERYPNEGPSQSLALAIGRTSHSLQHHAGQLGLKMVGYPQHTDWTPEQDEILRQRYPTEKASVELRAALGNRTRCAIRHRAVRLGVAPDRRWTTAEDAVLRLHYELASPEELHMMFPKRPWGSILQRATKLGLDKGRFWSKEEDEAVRRLYPLGDWDGLHRAISRRGIDAIKTRAWTLGVVMSQETKERLRRDTKLRLGQRSFKSYGRVLGYVVSTALKGAEVRGIDAPLLDGSLENIQYLDSLITDRCALSGRILTYATRTNDASVTASLDRIDSSKGYVKGNVQWVHKAVNMMKQALDEEAFVAFCCDIARYRGGLK